MKSTHGEISWQSFSSWNPVGCSYVLLNNRPQGVIQSSNMGETHKIITFVGPLVPDLLRHTSPNFRFAPCSGWFWHSEFVNKRPPNIHGFYHHFPIEIAIWFGGLIPYFQTLSVGSKMFFCQATRWFRWSLLQEPPLEKPAKKKRRRNEKAEALRNVTIKYWTLRYGESAQEIYSDSQSILFANHRFNLLPMVISGDGLKTSRILLAVGCTSGYL